MASSGKQCDGIVKKKGKECRKCGSECKLAYSLEGMSCGYKPNMTCRGCVVKFRYGLVLPKKPGQDLQPRLAIFGDGSDSGSEDGGGNDWVAKSLKRESDKGFLKKQTQLDIKKALEEDPTVYQYDEIYDKMEEKKAEEKNTKTDMKKKPIFIQHLYRAADRRRKEQERRNERKIEKERVAEGDMFKDKESFVTSSYKQKLEEMKKFEEEEKRQDHLDTLTDVTKQKDLGGFYRHLFRQTVGDQKPQNAAEEEKHKPHEADRTKDVQETKERLKGKDANKENDDIQEKNSKESAQEHELKKEVHVKVEAEELNNIQDNEADAKAKELPGREEKLRDESGKSVKESPASESKDASGELALKKKKMQGDRQYRRRHASSSSESAPEKKLKLAYSETDSSRSRSRSLARSESDSDKKKKRKKHDHEKSSKHSKSKKTKHSSSSRSCSKSPAGTHSSGSEEGEVKDSASHKKHHHHKQEEKKSEEHESKHKKSDKKKSKHHHKDKGKTRSSPPVGTTDKTDKSEDREIVEKLKSPIRENKAEPVKQSHILQKTHRISLDDFTSEEKKEKVIKSEDQRNAKVPLQENHEKDFLKEEIPKTSIKSEPDVPKPSIWEKRTVGEFFEAARNRYLQRLALKSSEKG